jgi:hypothetical protein
MHQALSLISSTPKKKVRKKRKKFEVVEEVG